MSRSYKKFIRFYTACSSDTGNHNFYMHRRRQIRRKINQEIRNICSHYGVEAIDDYWKGPCLKTEDQWLEPTDGHWAYNKNDIKRLDRENNIFNEWYHKKTDKYLKPKNRKHYRLI